MKGGIHAVKRSYKFLVWSIFLLFHLVVPVQGNEEPGPRLLSDAERHGARLAAEYLIRGPEAWLVYLAPDSSLASLDRGLAETVLEIKAGPPSGAVWRQQTVDPKSAASRAVFTIEFPSGLEEILILELEEGTVDPRIRRVWMSADPPRGLLGTEATSDLVEVEGSVLPESAADDRTSEASPWLPAALGAASLFLLGLGLVRRSIVPGLVGAAGVVAAVWLLAPLIVIDVEGEKVPVVVGPPTADDLRSLLALRRELAAGDEEIAGGDLAPGATAARIAALWRAQRALAAMSLNEAEQLLGELPVAKEMPLETLLRARLALSRFDAVGAVQGYERVSAALPRYDGLVFEMVEALELHGFKDRAARHRQALAELRSRRADIHYYLASSAASEDLNMRAAQSFQRGWQLEPMRRGEILRRFYLTSLLMGRDEMLASLALGETREAVVPCADRRSTPLPWPVGAGVRTVGGLLVVEVGDSRLEVPGGCGLAPSSAPELDAGTWFAEKDQVAIDRLPALERQLAKADGYVLRPGLLHRLQVTAEALVRRKLWQDVVRLTDRLPPGGEELPPTLLRARAAGLQRVGRIADAASTLAGLARSSMDNQRFDPVTLYQLAELLVSEREYDLALKLMARAHEDLPPEVSNQRMLQVKMEKRLMESSLTYETEHFRVLYSTTRPTPFARQAAEILEAEMQRLQHWIPGDHSGVTEVLLLDFGEFRAGYGGGIVGLFDGKIRLPFGEVQRFNPLVVSVMTHELAHAMITRVTGDRAPSWVQEGLAQHVEMYQVSANPIRGYERRGSRLAFPVIEDVLTSFASPYFIPVAYEQARWGFHFIESRFGAKGVHRLLGAFRDGLDDRAAVQQAFGVSLEELDRMTWAWCREQAPDRWKVHLIDYED